jgi:FAD:protein FMN transferase
MTIKQFSLLIIILSVIFSCQTKKFEYARIAGEAQGGTYHVTYENSPGLDLKDQIDSILNVIDYTLSIYNPKSIISRINANDDKVQINTLFKIIFQKAIEVNINSGGAFDVTVGPLVNVWGFGAKKHTSVRKSQIDTLLQYIGMDKVQISGNKIIKKYPQVCLDFNAIAQGFSVDIICKYFDSLRIRNYLVEVGGEVRAKGKNAKGEDWRIGIDKPIDRSLPGEQIQAILTLSNKSVATSGDYRKFYIQDGIKYAHHIDPHTGYPEKQNLLSASVIAKDCITADAYGTACMVMGLAKSKLFFARHPELDAYLIYSDDKGNFCEYQTSGVAKILKHNKKKINNAGK